MHNVSNACMRKANAPTLPFPHIGNRVPEAACASYHRYGAVLHGIHLIESAGLNAARHKQEICAGIHAVTQSFIVPDHRVIISGKCVCELPQLPFNMRFSAPEDQEIYI